MLYIVPTPIGNLKDITLRALETLQTVDGIICEDTRRAGILLSNYKINKPLMVLNDYNETKTVPLLIKKLSSNQNLALVSDAGTPLISDPGFKLVRTCIEKNLPVDSLPGPVSPIVALTLSALPPDKFLFLGYPPDKIGHREQFFKKVLEISKILNLTFIIFVAPFKLNKTLSEMKEVFGNIQITLAKELTKIHQTVLSGKISIHLESFEKLPPKGEFILLFNLN